MPIDGAIYRLDLLNCEKELIVDLNGFREENPVISSCVFHPDGSLYIFSEVYLYKYGVLKKDYLNRTLVKQLAPKPPIYAAINEDGTFLLTSVHQDEIFDYNLLNPYAVKSIPVPDFKDLHDRYIGGFLDSAYLSSAPNEINGYHLWNLAGDAKSFKFLGDFEFNVIRPVIYYHLSGL